MEKYKITTDNTADLPYTYYKEHDMEYMYLTYQLVGKRMSWIVKNFIPK